MTGLTPADDVFIRRTVLRAQVPAMRMLLIVLASLAPVAAQAETIRLTPEQAEAAIEAGAAKKARTSQALPDMPQLDRGVHGEVGMAIGTGGYRSMYGVVGVPLGDTGGVVLGFDQERGRLGGVNRGNLCRGISASLCDARINSALLEANR